VERKYFPPIFPSDEYFVNDEDREILVNVREYKEIIRVNKELRKSPYIDEDEYTNKDLSVNMDIKVDIEESIYEDAKSHSKAAMNTSLYEVASNKVIEEKIVIDNETPMREEIINNIIEQPQKAKSVHDTPHLDADICNIATNNNDDIPYKKHSDPIQVRDSPEETKYNMEYNDSQANTKERNKFDVLSTERKDNHDAVYQSQQFLLKGNKENKQTSLEGEVQKTSCCSCSGYMGKSKCLIF